MKRTLWMLLAGLFVFTVTPGNAMASIGGVFIREGSTHGVKYMTGGVGLTERAAMDRMAKGYDLKLVFAEPSKPYLAVVKVSIQDRSGKRLIETTSDGPWFFAKLPDGEYTVMVTHNGNKEVKRVEIGQSLQAATETQPVKTEAAKVEQQGTNVQPAPEHQMAKTEMQSMNKETKTAESGESLQTVTFYWKA
jgi:hypothetical protein